MSETPNLIGRIKDPITLIIACVAFFLSLYAFYSDRVDHYHLQVHAVSAGLCGSKMASAPYADFVIINDGNRNIVLANAELAASPSGDDRSNNNVTEDPEGDAAAQASPDDLCRTTRFQKPLLLKPSEIATIRVATDHLASDFGYKLGQEAQLELTADFCVYQQNGQMQEGAYEFGRVMWDGTRNRLGSYSIHVNKSLVMAVSPTPC